MNNDRLKFRVWNSIYNQYDYSFSLDADGRLWNGHCPREAATFEQCTGLYDKNGKLIYEGDVVRFPDGFGGEVAWWDGLWIYDRIGLSPLTKHIDGIEVIGNIHEEGK